ncbi:MAG: membrane protease subunit [Pseudomonadota bacterium]
MRTPFSTWILGALLLAIPGTALLWGGPAWNVWRAEMSGKAALARAENERKVLIEEARARAEAAQYLSEAEVERARGVAEANQIIADGLGGPEGYLRYLWINKLGANGQDVIYVPTEAGIPLLEAGRGVVETQ